MSETIQVGDLTIRLTRKAVKHVHLSVHPPEGRVTVVAPPGARTEVVPPTLNDPPGVLRVLFDLTLPQAYTDTFANLGVTVFGHALNASGGPEFGNQVQFADQFAMAGLAAGTYLDQAIELDLSVGPYRPGDSFNEIFGPGENDLTVASAFQFFVNKNVLTPITFYIDNVRLVSTDQQVPEPGTLGLLSVGAVLLGGRHLARRLRRRSGGS